MGCHLDHNFRLQPGPGLIDAGGSERGRCTIRGKFPMVNCGCLPLSYENERKTAEKNDQKNKEKLRPAARGLRQKESGKQKEKKKVTVLSEKVNEK